MSWWDRLLRWVVMGADSAAGVRVLSAGKQADLKALADTLEMAPRDSCGDVVLSAAVVREVCERLRGIAG